MSHKITEMADEVSRMTDKITVAWAQKKSQECVMKSQSDLAL
jgi:hypothetical protein